MVNVNDYSYLSDNEAFDSAIFHKDSDGIVIIPPRKSDIEPERDWWLLDRAILLPENTTVILQNCKIKLSDKCRDNFFRTANCGIGIEYPEKIENVHIKGMGLCVLEGADHPRAVGDSEKVLSNPCPHGDENIRKYAQWIPDNERDSHEITWHDRHAHSFGTDAGKEGESQHGDWRNIGVLFANVHNFSVENIKLVCYHGWGISFEACAFGSVKNIIFDANMSKEIDGMLQNMENQDGLNLRNGCHDITISDITGNTGDDLVALTAIASPDFKPGGSLRTTHVMHNDWTKRERDIYNVIIRNLKGTSHACLILRLLPCEAQIHDILIDGIVDTTVSPENTNGTIGLGEPDGAYGKVLPGSLKNIIINNVISNRRIPIKNAGYLEDSIISNIVNKNPDASVIDVSRKGGMKNVTVSNIVTTGNKEIVCEHNR